MIYPIQIRKRVTFNLNYNPEVSFVWLFNDLQMGLEGQTVIGTPFKKDVFDVLFALLEDFAGNHT